MTAIIIVVLAALAVLALFVFYRIRETFFSRDFAYGKANSVLWDRYLQKAIKSITKENADIKNMYKYPGTGDYTGLMCRFPDGVTGCTSYNTYLT